MEVEQVFGVEFGVSVFELVVGSVFFVEFFYANGDVFLGEESGRCDDGVELCFFWVFVRVVVCGSCAWYVFGVEVSAFALAHHPFVPEAFSDGFYCYYGVFALEVDPGESLVVDFE